MLFLAGMAHAYMGFYFDAGVLKGRCVCFACVYVQYVCVYVLVRGCIMLVVHTCFYPRV